MFKNSFYRYMSLLSFDKVLKIIEIICKVLLKAIGVINPEVDSDDNSD